MSPVGRRWPKLVHFIASNTFSDDVNEMSSFTSDTIFLSQPLTFCSFQYFNFVKLVSSLWRHFTLTLVFLCVVLTSVEKSQADTSHSSVSLEFCIQSQQLVMFQAVVGLDGSPCYRPDRVFIEETGEKSVPLKLRLSSDLSLWVSSPGWSVPRIGYTGSKQGRM